MRSKLTTVALPLLFFAVLGFLTMGYHPGYEDDGIYLAAVKADLNPALYPHDAIFFRLQLQASLFDTAIAGIVHGTGINLAWVELLLQFLSLAVILWAGRGIACKLFAETHAQWAAVAMLGAMFTLPVAGTALFIADQHLHPRNLATMFFMVAFWLLLKKKIAPAIVCLCLSLVMHPIMGAMGVSFALFLWLFYMDPAAKFFAPRRRAPLAALAVIPLFGPPNPAWRQVIENKSYLFLGHWQWYEWLGVLAPLALFWLLARFARQRGQTHLARFALAVFWFGVAQQTIAILMLMPPALIRLAPLQPMRYLQIVYIFLVLIGGGLAGRYLLRRVLWRWAAFLLLLYGSMFLAQQSLFASTPHLELPGVAANNDWLQAFAWIRLHTPQDAYFALDPYYLEAPGEDFHGFRALAERSQLADAIKDASVVTQVPELGPIWANQVAAQQGWRQFQLAGFERLKSDFGVNWVLVAYPHPDGLACRWHNRSLAVCQIP